MTKIRSKYFHCQTVALRTYFPTIIQNIQYFQANNYLEYLEIDILSINSFKRFYSLLPCVQKLCPGLSKRSRFSSTESW